MAIETPFYLHNRKRIGSRHLIAVEGVDDAIFISELLSKIGADNEKIGIVDVGGNNNYFEFIRQFFKSPGFTSKKNRSLSIICDADEDHHISASKIQNAFSASGYKGVTIGELTETKEFKIGLFVLPNCTSSGDLEKLCLDTVSGSELVVEAKAYIEKAIAQHGYLNGSMYKRIAQVYLAGMKNSLCRGAGFAFKDGHFDSNHAALYPLTNFLGQIQDLD